MHTVSAGQYITPQQLAEELGIGEVTLWRWRRDGVGPRFHRVGPRAIRYARADVAEWMESHAELAAA
jgi:excisionase family DNA binding protein